MIEVAAEAFEGKQDGDNHFGRKWSVELRMPPAPVAIAGRDDQAYIRILRNEPHNEGISILGSVIAIGQAS